MLLVQKRIFGNNLDDGEKLFEILHRHSIEVWGRISAWIGLGIVPPFFVIWYAHTLGFMYSWWLALPWMAISTTWIIYHLVDWYFDALLITNYSLIHVQWHGIFEREAARIEYEDIKEVSYITDGIIPTSFNYGDLSILSISGGKTVLRSIPDPQKAEQLLRKYKNDFIEFQRYTDSNQLEKILSGMVQNHVWEYGKENGFLPKR